MRLRWGDGMGKRINIPSDQYLKGLKDVVSNIQDAVDDIEHGSAEGLAEALLYVATESQQRAPVDTGDLRGSVEVAIDGEVYAHGNKGTNDATVTVTGEVPESATKGEVSYNTPYAADQHEQISYDHPRGGQAKYLESVLVENKDRILRLIADGIADELEG